jgi:hypothetical protein
VIADRDPGDTFADRGDDAGPFVAGSSISSSPTENPPSPSLTAAIALDEPIA